MHPLNRSSGPARSINIWPGWVDALSSLLMVVIFVLMVFMVTQFYLSNLLSGQEERTQQLNRAMAELTRMLDQERGANADLRARFARLSGDLQGAVAARDALTERLGAAETARASLAEQLAQAIARAQALTAQSAAREQDLAQAQQTIAADREAIELRLREIASLQADIRALRTAREELEQRIAATAQQAAQAQQTAAEHDRALAELGSLRDRSQALEARLAGAEERTMLAQRTIDERDIRIEELVTALNTTAAALDEKQALTTQQRNELANLSAEIGGLRDRLQRLEAALRDSESTVQSRDLEIANLNARLNQALVRRVEELSRYRSEFFGRLRELLGNRPGVRVAGDRFVFQSEVLFPTGSASLQPGGREQLAQFARTLLSLAREFPPNIDWILRVDGHTDRRPIVTGPYLTNWELSTARATEVVRYLISQGIPPERLAAAGFGEFQPLDPADTEDAHQRNRRIELKLDQR